MFPSPLGDLYISIVWKVFKKYLEILFPSPLGDLYISIWNVKFFLVDCFCVSVPSRGLIYLNRLAKLCLLTQFGFRPLSGTYISQYDNTDYRKRLLVSVPSRGLIYLNYSKYLENILLCLFPSPLGDLYISIKFGKWFEIAK